MSYTAKILRADKQNDKWKVVVEYANGAKIMQKGYLLDSNLSAEKAAGMLRAKLTELDDFEAATLPFPIGEVLDLTPPPPPPPPDPVEPTAEQIAKNAWFDKYYEMESYQKLIDVGVIDENDMDVVNLKADLQADYLPEYLSNI